MPRDRSLGPQVKVSLHHQLPNQAKKKKKSFIREAPFMVPMEGYDFHLLQDPAMINPTPSLIWHSSNLTLIKPKLIIGFIEPINNVT